jgi:hypothetical protein
MTVGTEKPLRTSFRGISHVNAVSEDEKTVLYIDLLFPHWFFGLVKNQYEKLKELKAPDVERIAGLEQSKVPVFKGIVGEVIKMKIASFVLKNCLYRRSWAEPYRFI